MTQTKKVGVWLDRREAFLAIIDGDEIQTSLIPSNIEDTRPGGGSRSKVPYGPMDKSDERKLLRRKQQQEAVYFETIMQKAGEDVESLYIFGPGDTRVHFEKFLREEPRWDKLISEVVPADSMTDNQKVAQVRKHFGLLKST